MRDCVFDLKLMKRRADYLFVSPQCFMAFAVTLLALAQTLLLLPSLNPVLFPSSV